MVYPFPGKRNHCYQPENTEAEKPSLRELRKEISDCLILTLVLLRRRNCLGIFQIFCMVFHKILLVDDDKTNQYVTYLVLDELQVARQVVLFPNGHPALEYVLQHCLPEGKDYCPDLILLDLKMPVMDGFEFLAQLHQLGQTAFIQAAVVVLTTSENDLDYLQARHWQVKDYLVKPLTVEKMRAFLERHYSVNGNGQ